MGIREATRATAGELRIGGQRSGGVTGHFDFRDDSDVTLAGVSDDLANVGLRIVTAVAAIIAVGGGRTRVKAVENICSPGTDLGEQRPFQDFNTPARVVIQVPVEIIELVERHPIKQLLHFVLIEEVAYAIEHPAAPGKSGGILDVNAGDGPGDALNGPRPEHLRRQQLQ